MKPRFPSRVWEVQPESTHEVSSPLQRRTARSLFNPGLPHPAHPPTRFDLLDGLLLRAASIRRSSPFLGFKVDGVQLAALFCSRDSVLRGAPKPRGVGGLDLRTDRSMPFPGSRGQPSILVRSEPPARRCTTHLDPLEGRREAGTVDGFMAETVARDGFVPPGQLGSSSPTKVPTALRASLLAYRSPTRRQHQTWSFDPSRSTRD